MAFSLIRALSADRNEALVNYKQHNMTETIYNCSDGVKNAD